MILYFILQWILNVIIIANAFTVKFETGFVRVHSFLGNYVNNNLLQSLYTIFSLALILFKIFELLVQSLVFHIR